MPFFFKNIIVDKLNMGNEIKLIKAATSNVIRHDCRSCTGLISFICNNILFCHQAMGIIMSGIRANKSIL